MLDLAPVLPIVVLENASDAVPVARALFNGGLPAIEVALRTPAAADCIRTIADELPQAVVGAGTVLSQTDVDTAVTAGARFLVSPGWTDRQLNAMKDSGLPFLPGVSTAAEVVGLLERDVNDMKFFPAEAAGGPEYLRALASPLPRARFCPTGGIGPATARAYLDLPNVRCVGGTWMLPQEAVGARDWARVEELARAAMAIARPDRSPHRA